MKTSHSISPTFIFVMFQLILWNIANSQVTSFSFDPPPPRPASFFQFDPECVSADCKANQHHFFWDFGDCDFSLAPKPEKNYFNLSTGMVPNVRLSVANIYEEGEEGEDAEDRPESGRRTVISTSEYPSRHEFGPKLVENVVPSAVRAMGSIDFSISSDHSPVPGYKILYAIGFHNEKEISWELEDVLFHKTEFLSDLVGGSFKILGISGTEQSSDPETNLLNIDCGPCQLEVFRKNDANFIINGSVGSFSTCKLVFEFSVPTDAELGTIIETSLGDSNKTVPHQGEVATSLDPNAKFIRNPDSCPGPGEWVYYTIQFRNEGSVAANNIIVEDKLDSNLDFSTFEALSSNPELSDPEVDRSVSSIPDAADAMDGKVKWIFKGMNILEPFFGIERSEQYMGFVKYRIKITNDIENLDSIRNTASIVFDANEEMFVSYSFDPCCMKSKCEEDEGTFWYFLGSIGFFIIIGIILKLRKSKKI